MAASFTREEVEELLGRPIGGVLIGGDRDALDAWLKANQQLDAAKNAIVPGFTIGSLGLDPGVRTLFTTDLKTDFRDNVNASLSNFGIGGPDSFYEDPSAFLRGETFSVPRGFTTKESFPTADTAGEFTEGAIELANLRREGLARETLVPLADPRFKVDIPNQSKLVLYGILAFATAGIAYGFATTAAAEAAAAGAGALEAAEVGTIATAGPVGTGAAPGVTTGGITTGGVTTGGGLTTAATIGTGAAPAIAETGTFLGLGTAGSFGQQLVKAGVGLGLSSLLSPKSEAQDILGGRAIGDLTAGGAVPGDAIREITGPAGTISVAGGRLETLQSPRLEGLLDDTGELRESFSGRFDALIDAVSPGFGRLTEARAGVFERGREMLLQRQQAQRGDLETTLTRRRVLGSSFAEDQLARQQLDFEEVLRSLDVEEAESLSNIALQELQQKASFIESSAAFDLDAIGRELEQLNIEQDRAVTLATSIEQTIRQAAVIEAQLLITAATLSQSAAEAGAAGLGTFLGPVVEAGVEEGLELIFGNP